MSCNFSPEELEQAVRFHGHNCPGLTIGIRAAELALRELDHPDNADMLTISETDMCGVDGIQYFTGCTLGKGNLLHRDFGKMAFSFYDRRSGRGFRALLKDDVRGNMEEELGLLMKKIAKGEATDKDKARNGELRKELIKRFLELDLEEMFSIQWLDSPPPRSARVLESLACEKCGEKTMESRTRRFGGKILCIPCFNRVEQKQ